MVPCWRGERIGPGSSQRGNERRSSEGKSDDLEVDWVEVMEESFEVEF